MMGAGLERRLSAHGGSAVEASHPLLTFGLGVELARQSAPVACPFQFGVGKSMSRFGEQPPVHRVDDLVDGCVAARDARGSVPVGHGWPGSGSACSGSSGGGSLGSNRQWYSSGNPVASPSRTDLVVRSSASSSFQPVAPIDVSGSPSGDHKDC
jgi:hypothetical protein